MNVSTGKSWGQKEQRKQVRGWRTRFPLIARVLPCCSFEGQIPCKRNLIGRHHLMSHQGPSSNAMLNGGGEGWHGLFQVWSSRWCPFYSMRHHCGLFWEEVLYFKLLCPSAVFQVPMSFICMEGDGLHSWDQITIPQKAFLVYRLMEKQWNMLLDRRP